MINHLLTLTRSTKLLSLLSILALCFTYYLLQTLQRPSAVAWASPERADVPTGMSAFPGSIFPLVIELEDAPVAEVYEMLQASSNVQSADVAQATQTQLAIIESAQQVMLNQLAALDVAVIYRTQRVFNGIGIHATEAQIEQLRTLPGIKAIHPLIAKVPDLARSLPVIGAPNLWQGGTIPPVTGAGIRVAIIDTGIDYFHTDFGGPGYGYTQTNDTVISDTLSDNPITPGKPIFPSDKVGGGWDFVGNSYDADPENGSYQPKPHPDPDPYDCYGGAHGSHVAGIIGGFGVKSNGATYRGPYDTNTNLSSLAIAPGVAPQVQIYALKVFGCQGSSEVTDLAIEWAVDPNQDGDLSDHVDVINLSLGSGYGATRDISSLAADRASAAGVIVVASAGNSNDVHYIVGSPSVAERVISVAASRSDAIAPLDSLASFSSRGPRRGDSLLKPDLAAPGYAILSVAGSTGTQASSKSGTSMAAPHVTGGMALLRQLHPDWSVQALKALVMNSAQPVRTTNGLSNTLSAPPRAGAGRMDLLKATGLKTIAFDAERPHGVSLSFGAPPISETTRITRMVQVVSMAGEGQESEDFGELSRAVRSQESGVRSQESEVRSQESEVRSQESEVRSQQPTANFQLSTLNSQLSILNSQFSILNSQFSTSPSQVVTNHYQIDYVAAIDMPGVEVELPITQVAVAEGGQAQFPVVLRIDPAQLEHTADPTFVVGGSSTRFWLSEETGWVRLNLPNNSAQQMVLPLYAAPYPLSQMHMTPPSIEMGTQPAITATLRLTGSAIAGQAITNGFPALVSLFEAVQSSPNTAPFDPLDDRVALTETVGAYDAADVAEVGIAMRESANGKIEEALLYFGIAAYADWASPNDAEFSVWIDGNEDGVYEYRLYNSDRLGYANRFAASDAFITAIERFPAKIRSIQEPLNGLAAGALESALYHNNLMILPVRAGAIGLNANNRGFDFYVESKIEEIGGIVDRLPKGHWEMTPPRIQPLYSANAPFWADLPGGMVDVQVNGSAIALNSGSGTILIFHHRNPSGQRVERVSITSQIPRQQIYFPVAGR